MTKRAIKGIIAMLMLLTICLYFVSGTYARYTSSVSGNTTVEVAKWAVAFKNGSNELSEGFNLNFTVADNANVVSGKIAPQTTATATIMVDLTGTEVAVDYEVSVNASNLTGVFGASAEDVKVTTTANGVTAEAEDGGTIALIDNAAFTESNGKVEITVTLTWTNNDNHNTSDTTVGKAAGSLQLPVTLTLVQHIDDTV